MRNATCRKRREDQRAEYDQVSVEKRQRKERRELETRAKEAAKERTILRLMSRYRDQNMDDDAMPPNVHKALQHAPRYRQMAEEEYKRMKESGGGMPDLGNGIFDFVQSFKDIPIEREEQAANEERLQQAFQESERRREEQQERSRKFRETLVEMKADGRKKQQRHRMVTSDVLSRVLLRYRGEGLQLTSRNDPTHDDDPLCPYLNWNQRAKEIIRDVVIERKGEEGRQVVKEVEELEELFKEAGTEGQHSE